MAIPLKGDRSAWDIAYQSLHASDLEDGATRVFHLPTSGSDGYHVQASGSGYVATDVIPIPFVLKHQTSTPSNPTSGYVKLYAKADDSIYLLDSSGTETEVGISGSGGGGGATLLDDLTDVVITSLQTNEILVFDGTNWINSTPTSGSGNMSKSEYDTNNDGIVDSANAVSLQGRTLASTAPTDGQALVWDNTESEWVPGTVTSGSGGGASALNDLTDVSISSPSTSQVLTYNGSNWINATPTSGSGGGGSDVLMVQVFSS